MYSDDDYYEEEYSGYGHTGDPNLDRWDLSKSLAQQSVASISPGSTMLCQSKSRSFCSTSRI